MTAYTGTEAEQARDLLTTAIGLIVNAGLLVRRDAEQCEADLRAHRRRGVPEGELAHLNDSVTIISRAAEQCNGMVVTAREVREHLGIYAVLPDDDDACARCGAPTTADPYTQEDDNGITSASIEMVERRCTNCGLTVQEVKL